MFRALAFYLREKRESGKQNARNPGDNHRMSPIDTRGQHLTFAPMNSVTAAPVDWIESVGSLRFPAKTDRHMQTLMDRNNEGLLSAEGKEELEALVELSEKLSLVRAEALQLLGKEPE